MLGIQSSEQLAKRKAFELWEDLCKRTGQRHDPCCIDVFMSAISQARGKPPCPWWHFTAQHLTDKRFPMVRYYGSYYNKMRGCGNHQASCH